VKMNEFRPFANDYADFSEWSYRLQVRPFRLADAPEDVKDNKELVMIACRRNGRAFRYASDSLRNDRDFVLKVFCVDSSAFPYLSEELRNDREIVLAACQQDGWALQYVSKELRNDKEVALTACRRYGGALDYEALKYATNLRGEKAFLLDICRHHGGALKFASQQLREDKDVVLVAVASDPNALKHALNGLNQDKDCLIAAGIWEEEYPKKTPLSANDDNTVQKKIVLSTRFALTEGSHSKATQFAILLKRNEYIRQHGFLIYSPNAFGKSTCDPDWTNYGHPCRGTFDTCQKEEEFKSGTPTLKSCWRFSFRVQLEQAKRTNGFMIQLIEVGLPYTRYTRGHPQTPGDGQKIETDMAQQVSTKVFPVYAPIKYRGDTNREREEDFTEADIEVLVTAIRKWYEGGCQDK